LLKVAEPDLTAFRGARIFMTGGTGFFGRWLTESWIQAQATLDLQGELHLLSRNPEARLHEIPHLHAAKGLFIHKGDQTSFIFPEGTFDAVIHGAIEHGNPSETFLTNLDGTRRVLTFAHQARAARLLLISSGAVYGPQPPELERTPETHPTAQNPLDTSSAYSLAKGASEFLAAAMTQAGGPACVIARAFAFVGPGLPLDRNYAIGNFIRDALGTGPIRIEGDGTPLRSYLYASDLTAWLWALLARGTAGEAYNVGSPESLSILELAQLVRNVLCPGREITLGAAPDPTRKPPRYVPDTSKAMGELGLRIDVRLEEALQRTADWARTGACTWA